MHEASGIDDDQGWGDDERDGDAMRRFGIRNYREAAVATKTVWTQTVCHLQSRGIQADASPATCSLGVKVGDSKQVRGILSKAVLVHQCMKLLKPETEWSSKDEKVAKINGNP